MPTEEEKVWRVYTVDRKGDLRNGGWSAKFVGTKDEVKELCKNVCKTIIELSCNYNVYLDYEEVE